MSDDFEYGALRALPQGATASYGVDCTHHHADDGMLFLMSAYKISTHDATDGEDMHDLRSLITWLQQTGLAHTKRVYLEGVFAFGDYMTEPKLFIDHKRYKAWVQRIYSLTRITWTYHPLEVVSFDDFFNITLLEQIHKDRAPVVSRKINPYGDNK